MSPTQQYGPAALSLRDSLKTLQSRAQFSGVNFEAIRQYCDNLLFRCLPEAMQAQLTPAEVEALELETIQCVLVLLLRDMLQQYPELFAPEQDEEWTGKWVEQFTVQLLEDMRCTPGAYVAWVSQVNPGAEEDSARLITGLSRQLGISPQSLWELHQGMIWVVLEDHFPEAIQEINP